MQAIPHSLTVDFSATYTGSYFSQPNPLPYGVNFIPASYGVCIMVLKANVSVSTKLEQSSLHLKRSNRKKIDQFALYLLQPRGKADNLFHTFLFQCLCQHKDN